MGNISNTVMLQQPEKSTHNMSEELKTTTGVGRITPVYIQEVVPADSIDINAQFITKFQPMVTPAFQNFNAYIHYFYVPFRILWQNWKYFIQNQPAPGATQPPIPPYLNLSTQPQAAFNTPATGVIHNYFGFQQPTNLENVNALPYAAYQLIYNEYYRHEKIHQDNSLSLQLGDGDQSGKLPLLQAMRYRTYKDDYFTAALQSPQSGNEASLTLTTSHMLPVFREKLGTDVPTDTKFQINGLTTPSATAAAGTVRQGTNSDPSVTGAELYVDPNSATFTISMNEMIELNRMQEFLVRQNLSGNRYNEYIMAFFGVRVPDLRLDRPDYICGIKAPVTVSEVLNTAVVADQGYQTGQGNAYAEGGRGNYDVLEHGLIMGLYTCMPEQGYVNAIQRLFYKSAYEDYYVPIFDQMGEREILNKELVQDHVDPYGTFGYVPKYSEYRLPYNKVTGQFAPTAGTPGSLSTWHMAQDYPANVVLDDQFFDVENPHSVFAVTPTTADAILLWIVNHIYINRPMKKYAMPVLTNSYGNNIV